MQPGMFYFVYCIVSWLWNGGGCNICGILGFDLIVLLKGNKGNIWRGRGSFMGPARLGTL